MPMQATEWITFANKYMRHDIGKAIERSIIKWYKTGRRQECFLSVLVMEVLTG